MNYYSMFVSATMLFYVMTKVIFNIFATIQMPMDIWSWIDIICAFAIVTSQSLTVNVTVEDVLERDRKSFFNLMMLIIIFTTWIRLIGFFFVI